MENRRILLSILFALFYLYSFSSKLITIDDGLSSRQVFAIQKGSNGFMWFHTRDGVNRYDGLSTTFYKLSNGKEDINSSPEISLLKRDSKGNIIELNKNGYIFRYNYTHDKFDLLLDFKKLLQKNNQIKASSMFLDSKDRVWINISNKQYLYDCNKNTSTPIESNIDEEIIHMAENNDNIYSLATTDLVYTVLLKNNKIEILSTQQLPEGSMINYIFYHNNSNKLIIATPFKGIYIYDYKIDNLYNVPDKLKNVFVNKMVPFGSSKDKILIATNGAGTYLLDIKSMALNNYQTNINEDYNIDINGNIIKDIYIDEQEKIWMAVYPFGVAISPNREYLFKKLYHFDYNRNSLVDNQVNFIFEDSDKDIWFLTNNGISCYNKKSKTWKNLLYDGPDNEEENNRVFLSMGEISPGYFIVSGYMAGYYTLEKSTMKATFNPIVDKEKQHPDIFIRSIYKDKDNTIWLGGFSHLKAFTNGSDKHKIYNIKAAIHSITSKSDDELWLGTDCGIYIFNKKLEKLYSFRISAKIENITSIYQFGDQLTFIGTNGNGVFLYNNKSKKIVRYCEKNSALNSNFIYSIIPSTENSIIISTEKGISRYNIAERKFVNWASEQGVSLNNFNPISGIKTSDGEYYFGGSKGVIKFTDAALLPAKFNSKLIFNSLSVNFRKVMPGEKDSPLECNIDQTENLYLKPYENTFTIELASINYDNPHSIYYSWFIEGLYRDWTAPSSEKNIKCINLPPGKYKLRVRSILIEDGSILEEKEINIHIKTPFWKSIYAKGIYLILIILVAYYISRNIIIRRERNMSNEKIRFFINTAHDIRTPLSLIQAPLTEVARKELLSEPGRKNIDIALDNTAILTDLTNNLINFEKEDMYSTSLNVYEYNLDEYVNDYMKEFIEYATKKNIHIGIHNLSDPNMTVLIDKNKIDSILRNIMSNAIKYTGEDGFINITISNDKKNWSIEITDTGIGISENDQNKLFSSIFRSHNATNMQVSGTGIGMLLTYRLVKNHKGKISCKSKENVGTTFTVSFPFNDRKYIISKTKPNNAVSDYSNKENEPHKLNKILNLDEEHIQKRHILVVEDNLELRKFLLDTLSTNFKVHGAANGLEALSLIKIKRPDLIVSDIMMPIMDGNELCKCVKEDIETSHIPIILLTALNDNDSIIKGLQTKADKYITKPFDIRVLVETINNIFANREIIRLSFSKGNFNYIRENDEPALDLDQQFLLKVTENIKENIANDINVDILCSNLNMSRSSFYNKIKTLTDYSPSDYIRKIKMEEAARLLRTKNYTVAEVADMVGFGDPKYFTDIFKRYFNITPSSYMKNN